MFSHFNKIFTNFLSFWNFFQRFFFHFFCLHFLFQNCLPELYSSAFSYWVCVIIKRTTLNIKNSKVNTHNKYPFYFAASLTWEKENKNAVDFRNRQKMTVQKTRETTTFQKKWNCIILLKGVNRQKWHCKNLVKLQRTFQNLLNYNECSAKNDVAKTREITTCQNL